MRAHTSSRLASHRLAVIVSLCLLALLGANGSSVYAVSQATTADADAIEEALELIRNDNVEKGEIILQRLAGTGNADALFHMAELYRLGIERDKNNEVATMYYRLASALDHERATLSLANLLYFEGDGKEKTMAEALSAWKSLAMKGDQESLYMLGMLYWNGEAGVHMDPVRGYGLVWKAAELGYTDAVQNELTMKSMLPADAREAAEEYANNLVQEGFSDERLAEHLILDEAAQEDSSSAEVLVASAGEQDPYGDPMEDVQEGHAEEPEAAGPAVKPEDWSTVWRLEVGYAMPELEVTRLQSIINSTMKDTVGKLFSDVEPSVMRPGLYRLIYGPMRGMSHAVNTCVTLKQAGHDCTTRPPEE